MTFRKDFAHGIDSCNEQPLLRRKQEVSVDLVAVQEISLVEELVGDEDLPHEDDDVEELAEEEAECVLVELVVHVLLVVRKKTMFLFLGLFYYATLVSLD